jgi:hypothetical protein
MASTDTDEQPEREPNGWRKAGKIGGSILVFITIIATIGNPVLNAFEIATAAELSTLETELEATANQLESRIVTVDSANDRRYIRIERMLDCILRAPPDMRPIDFCRDLQN